MTEQATVPAALVHGLDAVVFRSRLGPDGRPCFDFVSDRAQDLFGVAPEDALADGAVLLDRIAASDRASVVAALNAACRGVVQDGLVVGSDCCGRPGRFLVRVSPLPEGRAAGLLIALPEQAVGAEQAERQREIIQLLHDIAATANEAPDADTAMRRCLDRLCVHGGWPIGHIWTVSDDEPRRLVSTDTWRLEQGEHFRDWAENTRAMVILPGRGLPGRALASGRPEWIVDVRCDEAFLRGDLAKRFGLRTGFAIPVRIGLEVVAVMEFFSIETIAPDPLLFQALNHIGIQIGRVVERDRATRNLKVIGELAQAASRAKSHFLANMSHELRTPLNAIIGFSETMVTGIFGPLENERYRDYVGSIHSAGRHLLDLVNDILDLSRIEARRMEIRSEPIDVADLATQAGQLMLAKAENAGIALAVEIAPGLPAIDGDPLRLRQVLLNLLSNALRATPVGGRVTITAALDMQYGLVLTIADTGRGMGGEELAQAFRAFESPATAYTTRSQGGMGLGLPLSKALVEMHGGILTLKSEPGRGTRAIIRLPPDRLRNPERPAQAMGRGEG